MIVCEGEVAVLGAQGEFEPHVSWRYILVCCRDLYNQLECERWGAVSGGVGVAWGSLMEILGLDLIVAASPVQHYPK